jgi:hypothetical protein
MYLLTLSCPNSVKKKAQIKSKELTAYPTFKVIDSKSPAVSPRVVALIFIIQNKSVSSGILFLANSLSTIFPVN